MKRQLFLLPFLACTVIATVTAGAPKRSIRKVNFSILLFGNDESQKHLPPGAHKGWISKISYCDLDGDGVEEAMVEGCSEYSGSGGSDIHKIYKLNKTGHPMELEFEELTFANNRYEFEGKPIFSDFSGHRNSSYSCEKGLLIETYHDKESDKLALYYKWNGQRFSLIKVQHLASAP